MADNLSGYCVVSTTMDSEQAADRLAHVVVEQRLAACVQIAPIRSTYWWNGAIETASEFVLWAKTRTEREKELCAFIRENHAYETPEILVTPITSGAPDYLDWIHSETRKTG